MVADACPELVLDWHPDNDKTPAQVSIGAKYRALWRCRTRITFNGRRRVCAYEWRTTVQNRAQAGHGCPACAGKAASWWNSLGVNDARLTAQWGPDNDRTPYDVTTGSGYRAQWQCPDCPKRWRTTVDKRYNRGHDCPDCSPSGQATPSNNLEVAAPSDLLRDWHPRNTKTPADYRPNANVRVWWRCGNQITFHGAKRTCGYEWKQTINLRFRGVGCAACAGKAAVDWNNLTITNPGLVSSWHDDNPLRPHEVTHGSKKLVLWRCLVTDCEHEW